ncbi:hypothetical protein IHE30_12290 [Mycetohabitans sp. B46]
MGRRITCPTVTGRTPSGVAQRGPYYRYPACALLALSNAERALIRERLLAMYVGNRAHGVLCILAGTH